MKTDYILLCWVAFNKGESPLNPQEMSFEMDYETAKRLWKGQDIRPVEIIIGESVEQGDNFQKEVE